MNEWMKLLACLFIGYLMFLELHNLKAWKIQFDIFSGWFRFCLTSQIKHTHTHIQRENHWWHTLRYDACHIITIIIMIMMGVDVKNTVHFWFDVWGERIEKKNIKSYPHTNTLEQQQQQQNQSYHFQSNFHLWFFLFVS